MDERDATRTYTLEKQHLEGPPTLHLLSIQPNGSIVYHYRYPGITTDWQCPGRRRASTATGPTPRLPQPHNGGSNEIGG